VSPGNQGGKWPLGGGDRKVLPPQMLSGDCPDGSCGGYKVREREGYPILDPAKECVGGADLLPLI